MKEKINRRLLFIADSLNTNLGGAELSTSSLILELSSKYLIDVICFDSKNIILKNSKNINLHILAKNNLLYKIPRSYRSCINPFPIVKILKKIYKINKPDVVLVGNIHDYISYALIPVLKNRKFKVIHIIRDTFLTNFSKVSYSNPKKFVPPSRNSILKEFLNLKFKYNPLRRYFCNCFVRSANLNITISKIMMEYLNQYNISSFCIYNGLNISKNNKLKYIKEFKDKNSNKYKILFPSRPSSLKGINVIYKLANYASIRNNKLTFLFTCSRSEFIKISKIKEANIPKNIKFLNWMNHKKLIIQMKKSDLVICPSQYLEPFGRVPIEAMNQGIPVAVSNYGALPEIVINKKNGLILDYENTSETYENILNLLKNNSLQKDLIINGYKSIEKSFSMQNVSEAYSKKIDSIINSY